MDEKKFVGFKKEELGVKEYIKRSLGKGRISNVSIEYTPVGEKIIVATSKPGLVIGRGGEKIEELTRFLKKKFKLDNPHIDIKEIIEPFLDAQLVADEIAILLEKRGSMSFKMVSYRMLDNIMKSGALGAELVISGKLPSERARTWRFTQGYLKKTGEPSKEVNKAQAQAKTSPGVVGIQVAILPPTAHLHDRITIDDELKANILTNSGTVKVEVQDLEEDSEEDSKTKKKAVTKKKIVKKTQVKEDKE